MQQYAVNILFYCKTTLHVSGAIHTHHQEYIKLWTTASGTSHISVQLPRSNVANLATLERGSCTTIWLVPEAVVTVLSTPDDGCGWHPKHVEWFCSKIKYRLYIVASHWTFINTGSSKKMDGIWNRYNLKSTGRIYTFGVLKCSEKFKVLDLCKLIILN